MNNTLIRYKIEQRVNKLSSDDYTSIDPSAEIEAFNKSMDEWVRRQLEGINQTKAGAEGSTRRIDDLQCILTTWTGNFTKKDSYWESDLFPSDYLEWCRVSAFAQDSCNDCPSRRLTIFEGNEADVDIYLRDTNRTPDYNWTTTFSTVMSNKFKIWTNGKFSIANPSVTYYRRPVHIQIAGVVNPDTGLISIVDVLCELPDNVIELIIDEAAAILCRDIDNDRQSQLLKQAAELNN